MMQNANENYIIHELRLDCDVGLSKKVKEEMRHYGAISIERVLSGAPATYKIYQKPYKRVCVSVNKANKKCQSCNAHDATFEPTPSQCKTVQEDHCVCINNYMPGIKVYCVKAPVDFVARLEKYNVGIDEEINDTPQESSLAQFFINKPSNYQKMLSDLPKEYNSKKKFYRKKKGRIGRLKIPIIKETKLFGKTIKCIPKKIKKIKPLSLPKPKLKVRL